MSRQEGYSLFKIVSRMDGESTGSYLRRILNDGSPFYMYRSHIQSASAPLVCLH